MLAEWKVWDKNRQKEASLIGCPTKSVTADGALGYKGYNRYWAKQLDTKHILDLG